MYASLSGYEDWYSTLHSTGEESEQVKVAASGGNHLDRSVFGVLR